jgi:hypothetical protein
MLSYYLIVSSIELGFLLKEPSPDMFKQTAYVAAKDFSFMLTPASIFRFHIIRATPAKSLLKPLLKK